MHSRKRRSKPNQLGWASLISFEALTSTAAPKLVQFSGTRQGMRLLDVACGTGVVALTASRLGAEVEGIDLTPELISRANENSKIMGLKAKFVEGDAEFLPYRDNEFDIVLSQYGHMFAPRPSIVVKELARVLKPGGIMALSVPRYLPELICWKLSKEYSQTPGGHVRIFRHNQLKKLGKDFGLEYLSFHWAHGLHSPYWWLQCLFWNTKDQSLIIKQYHKLLVWDLMQRPIFTRILEMILQPLIGKSLVMYFKKPLDE